MHGLQNGRKRRSMHKWSEINTYKPPVFLSNIILAEAYI
jgi:hypothetical protein